MNLEQMKGPELLKLYNQLAAKADLPLVKRFATRAAGLKRTIALLEANKGKTAAPKAKKAKGTSTARTMTFDVKPAKEIKGHRADTKRATLIQLLSRKNGATFQECMDATGFDKRNAYEGIKLLNTYVGYGLRQNAEKTHIFLVGHE